MVDFIHVAKSKIIIIILNSEPLIVLEKEMTSLSITSNSPT